MKTVYNGSVLSALGLKQDVCQFANIFKMINVNEIFCSLIKISLRLIPEVSFDTMSELA